MDHRQPGSGSDRPTLPSLPDVFPELIRRGPQQPPPLASPAAGGAHPSASSRSAFPAAQGPGVPGYPSSAQASPYHARSSSSSALPQHPHWDPRRAHAAQHAPARPGSVAPPSRVPVPGDPSQRSRTPQPHQVQYGLHQLGAGGALETIRTDSQRPIERYRLPAIEDTRPKNHICPHCQAAYSRRSALEIHIRRHTGERPFVCTLCSRDYMSVSNLNRHYRQSHPTIEAPGDEEP